MTATHATEGLIDDARARRNSVLLSAAHSLYGMHAVLIIASGGLIGQMLADDKSLATVPISTFATGTACFTVPAALFMRKVGRRVGFLTGASCGLAGSLLALYAIIMQDFWLFAAATFVTGGYQAFAQQYRFAAADVAERQFQGQGNILRLGRRTGVCGVRADVDHLDQVHARTGAVCRELRNHGRTGDAGDGRDRFYRHTGSKVGCGSRRCAPAQYDIETAPAASRHLCGMITYGVMNLVMTASPVAMVNCGFSIDSATWVIQWHVLAMYIPSFFTGHLINRFGKERIIALGMVLLALCAVIALSGIGMVNFGAALVLLGLGWNFGFVGATALVTDCYRPSEKNKVQAVNELCVFGTVACASFMSGQLLAAIGWDAVAWAVLPCVR